MIEDKIKELIRPLVEGLGYSIVLVDFSKWQGKTRLLQVFAEKSDGSPLSLDDCTTISRNISALLDTEDVINDKYNLEVSSPGIDRPLVTEDDFIRFSGETANVKFIKKIEDTGKVKGIISLSDNKVKIQREADNKIFTTDFENISSAKLAITDEILKGKKLNK